MILKKDEDDRCEHGVLNDEDCKDCDELIETEDFSVFGEDKSPTCPHGILWTERCLDCEEGLNDDGEDGDPITLEVEDE